MRSILFGVALLGGVGCVQMHPIGPLARMTGTPKGAPPAAAKDKDKDKDKDAAPAVTVQRPAPPAELITPDQVSADPAGAAQRVLSEIEADRKTIPGDGRTAEISVIKGGEKIR
jgi:hypothetical protein